MSRKTPTDVELEIVSLDEAGLGVAHWQLPQAPHEQREVRVRNALPGEQITGRILKRRRGLRFADGLNVIGAAAVSRVSAPCEYFPRCGGCSLQHMDHTAQLAFKQGLLEQALEQEDVVPAHVRAPTSVNRLGYRRKARLGVRQVGERVMVGFRESFANRVADMSQCRTLTPRLSNLLAPLRSMLARLSIADQIPQIEVAQSDSSHDDARVAMILRHLAPLSTADERLLGEFAKQHQVEMLLQPGGYDTVQTLSGSPPSLLAYDLPGYGLYMQFDPRQFTQVNNLMNQRLVQTVHTYLHRQAAKTVLDLFCGIGNFSIPLARRGWTVTGYELDPTAIGRAQANAQLNGVTSNTSFHVYDLHKDELALPAVDAWVIDPPRSGVGPQLQGWLDQPDRPAQIAYVSCNPVSFAADARKICASGYKLREVGIYDMFPQTAHVETLGHFVRG